MVEVELGHRHVVLEAPLNWLPSCVNRTERRVTVLYGANDDPNRDEIKDFVEVATLHHHFLVDASQVLWSTCDLGSDVKFAEATTYVFKDVGQVDIALWGTGGDHVVDFGVSLWMK